MLFDTERLGTLMIHDTGESRLDGVGRYQSMHFRVFLDHFHTLFGGLVLVYFLGLWYLLVYHLCLYDEAKSPFDQIQRLHGPRALSPMGCEKTASIHQSLTHLSISIAPHRENY